MLLLGVALATLFHELAASEVADEHQVVISYIKDKAPRVWCVDLRLGFKTGYPRWASFEVDDSAIMDFIFVYPGWSLLPSIVGRSSFLGVRARVLLADPQGTA